MTFKSKMLVGMLTMVAFFAMTSSSFAQISLSVTTDPTAGEVQTNNNAQTASPGVVGAGILVSGSLLANSPLTTTIIRFTFPSPITSSPLNCLASNGNPWSISAGGTTNHFSPCPTPTGATGGPNIPTADPIRIEGASGVFASITQAFLNTSQSRIEVALPGFGSTTNTTSGSFRLVGTRIDANGKSGAQTVSIALDTSANNYILTTTSGTVISSIGAGIGSLAIGARPGATTLGTSSIFTNRTVPDTSASIIIQEGFASAFRTAAQSSNNSTAVPNGTNIRLTFSGIPSGVTLTLANGGMSTSSGSTSNSTFTITGSTVHATSNVTTIQFTSTSLTSIETLMITATVNTPLAATASVTTPGAITVTATLAPIGDATFNDDPTTLGMPRQDQGYPTFTQLDVGPVTVVNIVAASTTMLIPLAERVGAYDTGIAIANTTLDPFGSTGGGAIPSAGSVRFDFFPATATGVGTPCFLQTSATSRPGVGIASDGTVPAGGTYLVLLSQLLPLSNCAAGDFIGYIFITANFLNGHGAATISDFRTYSLATNVLILLPPAVASRATPGGSAEILGF